MHIPPCQEVLPASALPSLSPQHQPAGRWYSRVQSLEFLVKGCSASFPSPSAPISSLFSPGLVLGRPLLTTVSVKACLTPSVPHRAGCQVLGRSCGLSPPEKVFLIPRTKGHAHPDPTFCVSSTPAQIWEPTQPLGLCLNRLVYLGHWEEFYWGGRGLRGVESLAPPSQPGALFWPLWKC